MDGDTNQESRLLTDDVITEAAARRVETLVHLAHAIRERHDPKSLLDVNRGSVAPGHRFQLLARVLRDFISPDSEAVLARVVDLPDVTDPAAIYI